MTDNRNTHRGELLDDAGDYDTNFSDEELPPTPEEEMREINLRSAIFLEQERAEQEAIAEEFEEELDALFATIKPGEVDPEEEKDGDDPSGWPDF
ncbi:MAG: hypothetical protein ABI977_33275 [Acidobacteriota bacterium]